MTWSPVSAGESRDPFAGPRGKGGKQGRQAKGPRAIPPGIEAAVSAAVLDGSLRQKDIAEAYGVSRWYVARLAATVVNADPEQMRVIRQRLPDRMALLAASHTEEALSALEDGRLGDATKATFGAKLAIEANRHAQPMANGAGGSLLNFIEALNQAGGGTLTVGPAPPEPPPPVAIDVTAAVESPEPLEDIPPMVD